MNVNNGAALVIPVNLKSVFYFFVFCFCADTVISTDAEAGGQFLSATIVMGFLSNFCEQSE